MSQKNDTVQPVTIIKEERKGNLIICTAVVVEPNPTTSVDIKIDTEDLHI